MDQNPYNSNKSRPSYLPEKIDTRKVVEMIKNADLYDLINISLRSSELTSDTVERFILKALEKKTNDHSHHPIKGAPIKTLEEVKPI